MLSELKYLTEIKKKRITSFAETDKLIQLKTNVPQKLIPFMESRKMYQVLHGGRSSAKTHSALQKLLIRASEKPNQTILCTREFQSSIATSTYAELKQIIYEKELTNLFKVKHDHIMCHNGSRFIFKGLARDIMQIKSIPNISICFVEEAETIGRELWDVLNPTLRQDGCELIIVFNPRERQAATYQMWLEEPIPEEDILRIEINYYDNPFNSSLILKKIEHIKEFDYARYEHIYLGKVLDMSEDVIFKGNFKIMEIPIEFINDIFIYKGKEIPMLHGLDFGFSVDPAFAIQSGYLDKDTIYFHNEICKTGVLPQNSKDPEHDYCSLIKKDMGMYGFRKKWRGDSSRPDTIAQLRNDGLRIEAAPKLKESIKSGIDYLKGKNKIINPKCYNMAFEAYNYKYKKDKNSGLILTEPLDKHNHGWDATRYAHCDQIASSGKSLLHVL